MGHSGCLVRTVLSLMCGRIVQKHKRVLRPLMFRANHQSDNRPRPFMKPFEWCVYFHLLASCHQFLFKREGERERQREAESERQKKESEREREQQREREMRKLQVPHPAEPPVLELDPTPGLEVLLTVLICRPNESLNPTRYNLSSPDLKPNDSLKP